MSIEEIYLIIFVAALLQMLIINPILKKLLKIDE
jgi:hypothetical protein